MRLNFKLQYVLLVFLCSSISQHSIANDWSLQVSPVWDSGTGWILQMEVTRTSKTEVVVVRDLLPWVKDDAIEIVAVPIFDGAKAISQAPLPSSTPNFRESKWAGDESAVGQIVLSSRFPLLHKESLRRTIAVCYRFEFSRIDLTSSDVVEGCVLLPHQRIERRRPAKYGLEK